MVAPLQVAGNPRPPCARTTLYVLAPSGDFKIE